MTTEIDTTTTAGKIAVMRAFEGGERLERRIKIIGEGWFANDNPSWDWTMYDYRIAPQPKTRPLRASDWDGLPVVWVRSRDDSETNWMVTFISEKGFLYALVTRSWGESETERLEWSTDRKTWKPFTVACNE